jgi:amino acid adenylation domain-containing protein/FkbH-like protein
VPNIIISSTFISDPLKPALVFWLHKSGLTMDVKFTAYNQVIQQLLDPNSLIRKNENGINVVSIRFEDWHDEADGSKLKNNLELFINALHIATTQSKSSFIISICPFNPKLKEKEQLEFKQLEKWLKSSLATHSNVYMLTGDELLSNYPVAYPHNDFTNTLSHIPYTTDFYTALGTMIARKTSVMKHSPYKVIVLDCDNTLWKGVCGEVGAHGVEVLPEFKKLQQFMLQQREQGMLLCLCSKNSEEDVIAVLTQHPDMILRKEHISAHRINWNKKSDNIRSLAKELGLGLDSFIFIDDNPIEYAEVVAGVPEVLSLQLPNAQANIPHFLQNVWFFDHFKVTDEDKNRAITYQDNSARERYKVHAGSMTEFISGLDLQVEISQLSSVDITRAAQLTQRTNQFNLTTIRRTEAEILDLVNYKFECRNVRVKDRFGDYGLVGLLFFKILDNIIQVDTFLLSCRVLGRGVEHAIISQLGKESLTREVKSIELKYFPTKRNEPALKFLQSISDKQVHGNILLLSPEQAAKVKINPDVNYSESIAENIAEIRPELQKNIFQSFVDRALSQETISFTDMNKMQQSIFNHQVKSRDSIDISTQHVSPKNDKEKMLTQIWEKALKISNIGTRDNYFHLDGNSLSAVQITSDIHHSFNVTLSISDLFNSPTIGELLEVMDRKAVNEIIKLDEVKQESVMPLSFAQQRIWFLNNLLDNKTIYNVPVVLRLKGDVQVDILQRSLDMLLARHAILRTRIKTDNDSPFQEIVPIQDARLTLKYVDISDEPQEVDNRIKTEISRDFSLSEFPLMRAMLIKTKQEEYILCLTSHHIITDAHSIDVIFNELSETYNEIKINTPSKNPQQIQKYQDFINWQNKQFQNKEWDNQIEFWKTQLADATYLELPRNVHRPERPRYLGGRSFMRLDRSVFQKLKSIAKTEQVTMFMMLLGIFQTLLYRHTGQDDLVIGTPIANRHHQDVSKTVGLFVNTLALRIKINKDLAFSDLLKEVKKMVLNAYENQDVPFEKVLESLQIKRKNNQHPLFPVMLSHRQKRVIQSPFDNLSTEFLDYSNLNSFFDMTLISEESDEDLQLCFEYSTELFQKQAIDRMLDYFQNLMAEISSNPDKKIADILRFNQDQEIKIIAEWNNTNKILPENKMVHQLLEQHAEQHPNHDAIVYQDQQMSYQELNKLTNQLAHILRSEYDVRPGRIVAIGMESSINYMVSILAILKAGGAYLPLDPEYPVERLERIVNDAKPSVLITTQSFAVPFSKMASNIINLDNKCFQEKIAKSSDTTLENIIKPTDLAYVIYTSGSTGTPKGVMVEHRSICNLIQTQKDKFHLSHSSRILQFYSMCFDASVLEWISALLTGSTLYMIPHNIKRDPQKLIEKCNQHQITHLLLPPSMLAMFPEVSLPYLKVLQVGGETCPENILKKWQNKVPILFNAYGPTEVTVCSSSHQYNGKSSVIIGKPNPNTQYYILDDSLKHVPIGMPGELYIGGSGLARGYLNRDDLTKERFLDTSMGRLYKTGDLARFHPDGHVAYMGRADRQVKIRGYRVELSEIEFHIAQHKSVQQAVVVLKDNTQLVAYVSLRENVILDEFEKNSILHTIQTSLKEKLPNYMLPAGFVLLDLEYFPMLPNGKIDRNNLRLQNHSFFQITNTHIATSDSIEFALSEIWKEKLNIEYISTNDDFFLIGGNSLLAVSLVIKIQEKFKDSITLDEFYSNSTIAGVSSLIKQKMRNFLNIPADDVLLSKCLLPIQPKGNSSPLFMVHPSFGLALPYMGLERYFSSQPIYGISNPHFGQTKNRFTSIGEMADFYNLAIQKIQHKGPYTLAGWSFGGLVALEMARKLKQQNISVNNVVLLDSYHPSCISDESESVVNDILMQYKLKPDSDESALIKFEMKENASLAKAYNIRYTGKVNIIKAQETKPEHHLNGWENSIFPKPKMHYMSCRHENLFDAKHVAQTAEQLKHSLIAKPPIIAPSQFRFRHSNKLFERSNIVKSSIGLVCRLLRFVK